MCSPSLQGIFAFGQLAQHAFMSFLYVLLIANICITDPHWCVPTTLYIWNDWTCGECSPRIGADPSSMQDACHMNLVKWPCFPWVLTAQWIKHPPNVWEVMGLSRGLRFFFVPCSCHVHQFTFHKQKTSSHICIKYKFQNSAVFSFP